MINLYTKFHINVCNLCNESERKLLMGRLTDRQTDRQHQSIIPFLLRKGAQKYFFSNENGTNQNKMNHGKFKLQIIALKRRLHKVFYVLGSFCYGLNNITFLYFYLSYFIIFKNLFKNKICFYIAGSRSTSELQYTKNNIAKQWIVGRGNRQYYAA